MNEGRKINIVQYLGIAADEPKRIKKHIGKPNVILPLVEIGWEEDLCGLISGYQNLLSPTYESSMRDGCWFCHNQSVGQLRLLRKNHPELWELLLKWDKDSTVTFKADGRTVHDFDKRFAMEDAGFISPEDPWKWGYIENKPLQLKMDLNEGVEKSIKIKPRSCKGCKQCNKGNESDEQIQMQLDIQEVLPL